MSSSFGLFCRSLFWAASLLVLHAIWRENHWNSLIRFLDDVHDLIYFSDFPGDAPGESLIERVGRGEAHQLCHVREIYSEFSEPTVKIAVCINPLDHWVHLLSCLLSADVVEFG